MYVYTPRSDGTFLNSPFPVLFQTSPGAGGAIYIYIYIYMYICLYVCVHTPF